MAAIEEPCHSCLRILLDLASSRQVSEPGEGKVSLAVAVRNDMTLTQDLGQTLQAGLRDHRQQVGDFLAQSFEGLA